MNYLKLLFVLALVVIFIGTSFSAIFGAGRVLTAVFKTYVFKVEECRYGYFPKPVPTERVLEELEDNVTIDDEVRVKPIAIDERPQEQDCQIDYNGAKRDVSNGLAMLIISTPIALLLFKKIKKFLDEDKRV